MKTLTSNLRVTFIVLLMIIAVPSLSAAQQYAVTDLGTLPGGKTSGASAISDDGRVAGYSLLREGAHAISWSVRTGMVDLGLLHTSDGFSYAYGINSSGTVVGASGSSAFSWKQATGMQDLGNLGGGSSTAYGINNLGQVVGTSQLSDGSTTHAFLWTATNGMQDLGSLGGRNCTAYAINDLGQVVGFSSMPDNVTSHAFLWTAAGGMEDLGTLGGPDTAAFAINIFGEVVGYSTTLSDDQVVFIWDSVHGMRSLGVPSPRGIIATGINDSGLVVGYLHDASAFAQPFVRTKPDALANLNTITLPGSPLVSLAGGINRAGQIAATGIKAHALLLTPTKQRSQRSKQ
jgi:probable HAF family extracellular repeat protein